MKIRLALALIVLAVLTRMGLHLLPAPPFNFTPIGAMGLFGAAYLGRRMAIAIPFAALFVSDLFINNLIYPQLYDGFAWITSVWIYTAFALVIGSGWLLLRPKVTPGRVLSASLLASVIFFAVTNFSVWVASPMYSKDLTGLLACYTAGIPFFGNTLAGDLFFSAALFGAYEWMTRRASAPQTA